MPSAKVFPRRKNSRGGVIVPHAPKWYQRLAAWGVVALVRLVSATIRIRFTDRSDWLHPPAPGAAIYCVWHNRLPLCMTAYYGYVRKRNQTAGLAALVSASKDGGFLAAILESFKVRPVRGSSSRRGPQALLELTSWAERGFDLAITPDGPRGPRYVVQEGIMSLAQVTSLPIIPVSYWLSWKILLRSWDQFQIPLPFSRCEVFLDPPIRVPREASDEQREELRQQLERSLRGMTKD